MTEIDLPQAIVVNRCLIKNEAGELLLLRRSLKNETVNPRNAGKWEFPGGKVEAKQTLDQGLHAEVGQETSFQVELLSPLSYPLSYVISEGKYAGRLYLAIFRIAKIVDGSFGLSDESEDSAWASPEVAAGYDLTAECAQALRVLGGTLLKHV